MGLWGPKKTTTTTTTTPRAVRWRVHQYPQLGERIHPDLYVTAPDERAAVAAYARKHSLLIHCEPSWGNPWYVVATARAERSRQVKADRA